MIKIRKATTDDIKNISDLISGIMSAEFSEAAHLYSYRDLEDFGKHYSGERDIFLVAEKDGKLVGTVAIKEDCQDTALLRRIFIHPDFRNKGYGFKLLNSAIDFCFERNYKNVCFRGTNRMERALQLCMKNGFRKRDETDCGSFNLVVLTRDLKREG
jgi:N-acetylglutamate synthase-like GNAT family acetyltransferase